MLEGLDTEEAAAQEKGTVEPKFTMKLSADDRQLLLLKDYSALARGAT